MSRIGIDVIWTAELAKSGWLAELDQSQFPLDQELKPAVDTAMFEGKLWAAPFCTNGGLLFYRKDILDKAGKQPPKTIDELKALCPLAQQNNMGCYSGQFAKYEGLTVNFAEAVQDASGEIMTDNGTQGGARPSGCPGLDLPVGRLQAGLHLQGGHHLQGGGRRAFIRASCCSCATGPTSTTSPAPRSR